MSFQLPVCNLRQVMNKKREREIYTAKSVKKKTYNKNQKNSLWELNAKLKFIIK